MCLALPARVVELLPESEGVIDIGGVRKRISLELVADVQPGDYVIIQFGLNDEKKMSRPQEL